VRLDTFIAEAGQTEDQNSTANLGHGECGQNISKLTSHVQCDTGTANREEWIHSDTVSWQAA